MSFVSGEESTSLSLSITTKMYDFFLSVFPNSLLDIDTLHLVIRKLAHFTEFFLLGITWSITFIFFRISIWKLIIFGLFIALFDEFIQFFSENRGPSIIDSLIFDFPGFVLGSLIFQLISKKNTKETSHL